jgi:hypothetical protein
MEHPSSTRRATVHFQHSSKQHVVCYDLVLLHHPSPLAPRPRPSFSPLSLNAPSPLTSAAVPMKNHPGSCWALGPPPSPVLLLLLDEAPMAELPVSAAV